MQTIGKENEIKKLKKKKRCVVKYGCKTAQMKKTDKGIEEKKV